MCSKKGYAGWSWSFGVESKLLKSIAYALYMNKPAIFLQRTVRTVTPITTRGYF